MKKATLAAYSSLLLLAMALAAAAPTSSAYTSDPAQVTLAAARNVDWAIPRTFLDDGKTAVRDAAYDPRSGRTFMLGGAIYDSGIWVSDRPGGKPQFIQLPPFGGVGTQMIYRLVVDADDNVLWVLLRTENTAAALSIARFHISAEGLLSLSEVQPLEHGFGSRPIALDARRGALAVAYGGVTADALGYVELLRGDPISVVARNEHDMYAKHIRDVAVNPGPGLVRVFIAHDPASGVELPRCNDGSCRLLERPGEHVEAVSNSEAWWGSGSYIVRFDEANGSRHTGSFLDPVGIAQERQSGRMYTASSKAESIEELSLGMFGIPETAERVGVGLSIRALRSGHELLLVLLDDGSVGWLIP